MEYHGKLYGKIGNKYFDTERTSNDFDEMLKALKESRRTICRLRLSMSVHTDCVEDSEFADYVDLADSTECHLEKLITKIEKL